MLAWDFFAMGAWELYIFPFTIFGRFYCVVFGVRRADRD